MAINTTTLKNTLASAYANATPYVALYTSAPSSTAGTEVSGSGYARQSITWSAPSNGVITGTVTFTVPSGNTVAGYGFHSAVTAGTYQDGASVTSQAFSTAGNFTLNLTYTQS